MKMGDDSVDVTKRFLDACKSYLQPGDVAHEKSFGLNHAMSAIDINNPSMDVGMPKNRKVTFLHDAIDSNMLHLSHFSDLSVLLGVMDELLTSFVNWLTGDTLAQTVFTCMYMHCIPIIEDSRLSLFCEGLRRIICGLRQLILTMPVFEEEDFSPLTHGVPLYKNTVLSFPDRIVANKLFETTPGALSAMIKQMEDQLIESPNQSIELNSAIGIRFRFLRCVLRFLEEFSPVIAASTKADIEEPLHANEGYAVGWHETQDSIKSDNNNNTSPTIPFDKVCSNIANTVQELVTVCSAMLKTARLGKDAGAGKLNPRSQAFDIPGFEPFLTQAFLPSSIQRFPKNIGRSTAFAFLACAFSRVNAVVERTKTIYLNNDIRAIIFHDFWAPLHQFGHNHCHSLFLIAESATDLSISDACTKSCVLSRASLSICISALSHIPPHLNLGFKDDLGLENPGLHFLVSWLSIESKEIQNAFLDHVSILERVGTFLNYVGTQLITVSQHPYTIRLYEACAIFILF